jgi:hypothetical protein
VLVGRSALIDRNRPLAKYNVLLNNYSEKVDFGICLVSSTGFHDAKVESYVRRNISHVTFDNESGGVLSVAHLARNKNLAILASQYVSEINSRDPANNLCVSQRYDVHELSASILIRQAYSGLKYLFDVDRA